MATLVCERCGKVDTSLRLTVFPWVVSIVIMSFKRAKVGIFCADCRSSERWKYIGVSALLGWWGIPFGLFWTLESLAKNAGGGEQPREQNAALLVALGQEMLADGNRVGAREAWTASLAVKNEPVVERALLGLDASASPATTQSRVRPGDVVLVAGSGVVRSVPDGAAPRVAVATGTRNVVLSSRDGWTQLRLADGQVGWVPNSDIRADA